MTGSDNAGVYEEAGRDLVLFVVNLFQSLLLDLTDTDTIALRE